jgi:hypothetical protein
VDSLQLSFRLRKPLDPERPLSDLLQRVWQDEEFGLDVVDYVLQHIRIYTQPGEDPILVASHLAGILRMGGSVWEVIPKGDTFRLSRRAVGPVREAIEAVPAATRAHQHLVTAWNKLSGRNPDASGAYREAVRAVEAAAKPVVLPDDGQATLGKMIAAMKDKPAKWSVTIGSVDLARQMMEAVWTSQLDRHGTDDESVPLTVSLDEADAAFATCLSLARLFAGGHVRPA